MPRLWMIRSGDRAQLLDLFIGDSHASVGYGIQSDIVGLLTQEEFKDAFRKANPTDEDDDAISQKAGNLRRFVSEIATGDYVVTQTTSPGHKGPHRFGVVVTPTYFTPEDTLFHHHTRRRVHWDPLILQPSLLSEDFQRSLSSDHAVFSLDKHAAEFFRMIGRSSIRDMA